MTARGDGSRQWSSAPEQPARPCDNADMRFFNTAGPVVPDMHYCVPPPERLDVDELLLLIRQHKYFVLRAPRQTGKTSALLALRDALNAEGALRCVYVEIGQSAREDVGAAIRAILSALALDAHQTLDDRFVTGAWLGILDSAGSHQALREKGTWWCSTARRAARGRRSSSAAPRPKAARRSRCGGCDRSDSRRGPEWSRESESRSRAG